MGKRYEIASRDLLDHIITMRSKYHDEIEPVTIGALFVYDETGEQCLTHQGYPAAALCRIVPARDRAAGMPDAQIVVDRAVWQMLTQKQKDALVDHELQHIEPVLDQDGDQQYDAQDRPKLRIRKHDRQFGWFDEVAARHGEHSIEVRQARQIIEESGQLYFDFDKAA